MDFQDLSKEQLIDIIHRQADDIAALELELAFFKQPVTTEELQPVHADGSLWKFRTKKWKRNGKVVYAANVMKDEAALQAILADPHQMILKRIS